MNLFKNVLIYSLLMIEPLFIVIFSPIQISNSSLKICKYRRISSTYTIITIIYALKVVHHCHLVTCITCSCQNSNFQKKMISSVIKMCSKGQIGYSWVDQIDLLGWLMKTKNLSAIYFSTRQRNPQPRPPLLSGTGGIAAI